MTSKRSKDTTINRKKNVDEILEDILQVFGWEKEKIEKYDELKQYVSDHLDNYGKMIICRLDYHFKAMLPKEYAENLFDMELEVKRIDEFVLYFFTKDFSNSPMLMELEDIIKLMKKANRKKKK